MPGSQEPVRDSRGLHGPAPHLTTFKRVPAYPHPDGTPESRRRASDEKYAIGERRLAHQAKQGEHARREQLRDHINLAALVCIWCVAGALVLGFFIWVFHLLAPDDWVFLSPQRISKLESIVTTGSVATVIANYIRQKL